MASASSTCAGQQHSNNGSNVAYKKDSNSTRGSKGNKNKNTYCPPDAASYLHTATSTVYCILRTTYYLVPLPTTYRRCISAAASAATPSTLASDSSQLRPRDLLLLLLQLNGGGPLPTADDTLPTADLLVLLLLL